MELDEAYCCQPGPIELVGVLQSTPQATLSLVGQEGWAGEVWRPTRLIIDWGKPCLSFKCVITIATIPNMTVYKNTYYILYYT